MKSIVRVSVVMVVLLEMFVNIGFAAEMKKVLFLHTGRTKPMAQKAVDSLAEKGFVEQQNVMIMWVEVSGATDPAQLITQVKAEAPDVILSFTAFTNVIQVLEQFAVPVITMAAVESFVDTNGVPTANVTGVHSKLQDMVYNSYKFLQKVAPLKTGQQVVFLDNREQQMVISKAEVLDALQRLEIPIKAVVDEGAIYEVWQQAILQYSDDPEVGWILQGSGPTNKLDGSTVDSIKETYPWQQTHLKKPSISHVESMVQAGTLCGFSIDLYEVGVQCGEMAASVLQGEPIQSIKAEYPHKVSIALNRKTATNLGIVFSLDVLSLANVIYDDYEGNQVIRK
ncbi:MAG: ABC transporter substrate binding protein [Candidatus Vecturithrix sp.]|nr:ABC transporter substrate binding protein [Candidatus Vecturithrix sp.]